MRRGSKKTVPAVVDPDEAHGLGPCFSPRDVKLLVPYMDKCFTSPEVA